MSIVTAGKAVPPTRRMDCRSPPGFAMMLVQYSKHGATTTQTPFPTEVLAQ
ncbi:MAG: hypothetical protein LBP58_00715 [Azoarcus sp.]|nr:hypothetical protein [Azoarcus sp.]